jgi:hypothetical protein
MMPRDADGAERRRWCRETPMMPNGAESFLGNLAFFILKAGFQLRQEILTPGVYDA